MFTRRYDESEQVKVNRATKNIREVYEKYKNVVIHQPRQQGKTIMHELMNAIKKDLGEE